MMSCCRLMVLAMVSLLFGIFIAVRVPMVDGEMFTAVVDLEKAVRAEQRIATALRVLTAKEQKRIDALIRLADDFETHSARALINPEKHLSNPVNAFQVVKRFTTNWDSVMENHVKNKNATDDFLKTLEGEAPQFPTNEDMNGVIDALFRLQDTYALSVKQMANGELHQGIKDSWVMSAVDCFDIGRHAYLIQDHYHTVLWMREALHRLEAQSTPPKEGSLNLRVDIYDHLAYSSYMQGDIAGALSLTDKLLSIEPLNERAQLNRIHYMEAIATGQKSVDPTVKLDDNEYRKSDEYTNYWRLCRGESVKRHSDKGLTCQFRRHHPMFYINPLREEVANLDPRMYIYHNTVTDSEIAKIQKMATPLLKRATVQNPATGNLETASYRVSKSAWLKDHDDSVVELVSNRTKILANLTGETVEELQVVNYGIGGHYEPHYDHAREDEVGAFDQKIGNRIATVMCYLSDVEAGGSTVFNIAGVRIQPEKGSCALWYNLKRNGTGDSNTRHAACPVLVGSKWGLFATTPSFELHIAISCISPGQCKPYYPPNAGEKTECSVVTNGEKTSCSDE